MGTTQDTQPDRAGLGVMRGACAEVTGRQRPEAEGGMGTARLPGRNAQDKSCSEYWLRPAAAISLDTWLLRGVKAAGGTAGALVTTFKAFVRAVGHGLPGANGFCLLLPSERRAGRRRRACSCLGPVPTPCCAAAPRQVGPTWAFQMPSNGHRATAPAGEHGEQPCGTCLFGASQPPPPPFRLQPLSPLSHAIFQERDP